MVLSSFNDSSGIRAGVASVGIAAFAVNVNDLDDAAVGLVQSEDYQKRKRGVFLWIMCVIFLLKTLISSFLTQHR